MPHKKKKQTSKRDPEPQNIDDVYLIFKGRGGSPEAESIVNDSKFDKDFVTIWSSKHDIAKIIERCRNSILDWKVSYENDKIVGCELKIKRSAFRGSYYAFKTNC